MFDAGVNRWTLRPDGTPIITSGARLLPVQMGGVPAMLEVAVDSSLRIGGPVCSPTAAGRATGGFHA
ncbi:MAG: hypothetical protein M3Q94_00490 [Pseudomonadota bacterium]|nr:hypothetical protein [Pseudomonadota bacterium]